MTLEQCNDCVGAFPFRVLSRYNAAFKVVARLDNGKFMLVADPMSDDYGVSFRPDIDMWTLTDIEKPKLTVVKGGQHG